MSVKNFECVKYGLLVINYHNKLFRRIFDNLFRFSLSLSKTNQKSTIAFIRGLFAAEGYVQLNKYGSLALLDIPIKDTKRGNFVKYLFKHLGIYVKDTGLRLLIYGYPNFVLINKFNLINLHPDKLKNFVIGFKHLIKYGNVPTITKLKIINLLKKEHKTRFQIAKEANLNISAVHKCLKDLEIKDIVKRENKAMSVNNRKLRQIWGLIDFPQDISILTSCDYK